MDISEQISDCEEMPTQKLKSQDIYTKSFV